MHANMKGKGYKQENSVHNCARTKAHPYINMFVLFGLNIHVC